MVVRPAAASHTNTNDTPHAGPRREAAAAADTQARVGCFSASNIDTPGFGGRLDQNGPASPNAGSARRRTSAFACAIAAGTFTGAGIATRKMYPAAINSTTTCASRGDLAAGAGRVQSQCTRGDRDCAHREQHAQAHATNGEARTRHDDGQQRDGAPVRKERAPRPRRAIQSECRWAASRWAA